ncbi:MAG: ABC transporter substrate-binding protein [Treponema sp.]|jgi:multiple sugar transport system substrate-binding protein|nr:ABC transporter substrate-binding protein [Treponema sp.]
MKKRTSVVFIWVLGVLLVVPGLLFARGGQQKTETSENSLDLRCWSFFSGSDAEFFNAMIAEYNRIHPGIRIILEPMSYTGYDSTLASAIADGTAPDVAVIQHYSLPRYRHTGSLRAMDDMLEPLNAPLDDFMPIPLETCRFDGKLFALPLDIHPLALYYNTDLFDQAAIIKLPETYAELIQTALAVKNRTAAIGLTVDNTISSYKALTLTRLFISLLKQQDADLLTPDNAHAGFNNIAGEKALSAIIDLIEVSKVVPPGLDYDASVNAFRLGKAGMHINDVGVTGIFEKQKGLNFAVIPLPPLLGRNATWTGSHTLAIPVQQTPDPRKTEAVLRFILWMTEHGNLWAKAGYIPVRESVSRQSESLSLPYRAAYLDAAASTLMSSRIPAWDEIFSAVSDSLENSLTVNKSVKTILIDMERKVNEIITVNKLKGGP